MQYALQTLRVKTCCALSPVSSGKFKISVYTQTGMYVLRAGYSEVFPQAHTPIHQRYKKNVFYKTLHRLRMRGSTPCLLIYFNIYFILTLPCFYYNL